jgi:hypothetical protein
VGKHLNKLLEPVRVINDNLDFHSLDEVMEAVSMLQQSEARAWIQYYF